MYRCRGSGEESVARLLGGRAADASDLRIAVEEDIFEVIGKFQVFDGLRFACEGRIPTGLAHRFALANNIDFSDAT